MHGLSATLLLVALLLAGPSVDASLTADQQEEIVALHNQARQKVKPRAKEPIGSLTWNEDLARKAQAWADNCKMGHNPDRYLDGEGEKLGENIAYSSRGVISEMVGGWEGEKEVYNFRPNTCSPVSGDPMKSSCGHYTQMVWADTTEIGCGYKQGCPGAYKDRLVCNYGPAGNMIGERPYKGKRRCRN